MDPIDEGTGNTLPHDSKRSFNAGIDRMMGQLTVGGSWTLRSSSYDDSANTQELGGYGVVDLRTSWKSSKEWEWDLKITNLLDKNYANADYYRPTGSSWSDPSQAYSYEEAGIGLLAGVTWRPKID